MKSGEGDEESDIDDEETDEEEGDNDEEEVANDKDMEKSIPSTSKVVAQGDIFVSLIICRNNIVRLCFSD